MLLTCSFNTNEFYLKNHFPDIPDSYMNYDKCEPGLNRTPDRATQYSSELMGMNDDESLGWDSEEGVKVNSKNILNCLNRTWDCKSQTEDVQLRLLETSDPYCRKMCIATDHRVWNI